MKWLRIYPRIFDTMREDAAEFAVQRLAGYRHKYMLIGVPAVCLKHNPCCVQAAQMGGRARLLLLDEVDAALDESNQRRAALLLQQLCAGGRGCQVSATAVCTCCGNRHICQQEQTGQCPFTIFSRSIRAAWTCRCWL